MLICFLFIKAYNQTTKEKIWGQDERGWDRKWEDADGPALRPRYTACFLMLKAKSSPCSSSPSPGSSQGRVEFRFRWKMGLGWELMREKFLFAIWWGCCCWWCCWCWWWWWWECNNSVMPVINLSDFFEIKSQRRGRGGCWGWRRELRLRHKWSWHWSTSSNSLDSPRRSLRRKRRNKKNTGQWSVSSFAVKYKFAIQWWWWRWWKTPHSPAKPKPTKLQTCLVTLWLMIMDRLFLSHFLTGGSVRLKLSEVDGISGASASAMQKGRTMLISELTLKK